MPAIAVPSISVDDLNQRVLRLIDSIRTRDDLAPPHLQRLTGVEVEVNAADPTVYGIAGPLQGNGSYSLASSHKDAAGQVDSLLLSLQPDEVTAPCVRAQDYRDALSAAGFAGQHLPAGHRGQESWYFTRDGVSVHLHVRSAHGAPTSPACLASLVIGVYP